MTRWLFRLCLVTLLSLTHARAWGSPMEFDLGSLKAPLTLDDPDRPRACTVTYLVQDDAANETYAARMQFTPIQDAIARNGHLACPVMVPSRVAEAALDECRDHAAVKKDCVFADMARGFEAAPGLQNTAENSSRCASDQSTHIAIACWQSGGLKVCNVGCGAGPAAALSAARNRCESKHQKSCGISGVLPVETQ
jgi:hypothetical protein